MMKILILSPYSPYPQDHGAAHRIHNLIYHLSNHGFNGDSEFDVNILFNYNSKKDKNFISYFNKFSAIGIKLSEKHYFLRQNNFKLILNFIKTFRKYDIIQIEFPYFIIPLLIAKLFHKKVIIDEHNVEFLFNKQVYKNSFILRKNFILFLTWISESLALHLADKIFVCSKIDQNYLIDLYNLSKNKFSIIPNGALVNSFVKYPKMIVIEIAIL